MTATYDPAAPEQSTDQSRRARWLALYVLCLGDLMIVLDQSIVNVALPSIRDDLGFSQSSLAWVVNAYLLTFGGFLLLSGRLGRPAGQQAGLPRRHGVLHRRLDRVRPGAVRVLAGRRPRGAGSRRRGGVRGRARADHGPVHRAGRAGQGDGRLRLRDVRRRRRRRAARRRAHRPLLVALDLPGQRADRHRRPRRRPRDPARRRRRARLRQARRPRRGAGDRRADARGLRHRRRQRGRLDLRPHARLPRRQRRPVRRVRRLGGPRGRAAGAAAPVPAAQPGRLAGRRHPLGGRDVRLVLPGRALPPGRAGLQRARGRPGLPPDQRGDGVLLAAGLGPAGDDVRHPPAAGGRPDAGRDQPAAVRVRAGRRRLRGPRAARR